jgi:hypothetical protein
LSRTIVWPRQGWRRFMRPAPLSCEQKTPSRIQWLA